MSIPLCDVQLLKSIVRGTAKEKLTFYKPYPNRAATAIILRFNGNDGVKVARTFSAADKKITPEEVVERLELHADPKAESSLSVLFLKKRLMQETRWSGVVAFPGGKRDRVDDKDDFSCARRWCDSQLGIPINTHEFVLLGRLPDFYMYSRAMEQGLMTARFVLLHVGELTPSVRIANHDIKALTWAPVTALTPANVVRHKEKHNLFAYFVKDENREFVGTYFPGAKLHFPSIEMPEHFGQLWGFTLSSVSTLFALHGQRRMDWPLFHSNSLAAQVLFVDPLHGYLEFTKNEVVGESRLQHQLSLGLIAFAAMSLVIYLLSFIAVAIQALSVAFDEDLMMQRRREAVSQHADASHFAYGNLAVDKDAVVREQRAAARAAASTRWSKEMEDKLPSEHRGKEFLSFSRPVEAPAPAPAG